MVKSKALRTFENDADLHDHNIRSQSGNRADSSKLVFPPVIVLDEKFKDEAKESERDEEIATQDESQFLELS